MNVADALRVAADGPGAGPLRDQLNEALAALHVLGAEVRHLSPGEPGQYVCRCGSTFGTSHGLRVHVGRLGSYEHGAARIAPLAVNRVQAQARIAAASALFAEDMPERRAR